MASFPSTTPYPVLSMVYMKAKEQTWESGSLWSDFRSWKFRGKKTLAVSMLVWGNYFKSNSSYLVTLRHQLGPYLGVIVKVTSIYMRLVKISKYWMLSLSKIPESPEIPVIYKVCSISLFKGYLASFEKFKCLERTTLSRNKLAPFQSFGQTWNLRLCMSSSSCYFLTHI